MRAVLLRMGLIYGFQELIDNGFVEEQHFDSEIKHFESLEAFYEHLEKSLDAHQRKLRPTITLVRLEDHPPQ